MPRGHPISVRTEIGERAVGNPSDRVSEPSCSSGRFSKTAFLIQLHLRSQQTAKGVTPFETSTQAEIVIRFVLNLRNKKALIPVKYYGDIKAFDFLLSYMCHIA